MMTMKVRSRSQSGFSLIEVLVAFSIMAMALGVLYQSSAGSVRAGYAAERNVRAALWAESLLASRSRVPPEGLSESGTTADGFRWQVLTSKRTSQNSPEKEIPLHQVDIVVSWTDRLSEQTLHVVSVVQQEERDAPK